MDNRVSYFRWNILSVTHVRTISRYSQTKIRFWTWQQKKLLYYNRLDFVKDVFLEIVCLNTSILYEDGLYRKIFKVRASWQSILYKLSIYKMYGSFSYTMQGRHSLLYIKAKYFCFVISMENGGCILCVRLCMCIVWRVVDMCRLIIQRLWRLCSLVTASCQHMSSGWSHLTRSGNICSLLPNLMRQLLLRCYIIFDHLKVQYIFLALTVGSVFIEERH